MKKFRIIFACVAIVLIGFLIYNINKTNDRPITYQIGTLKEKFDNQNNPYSNTIDKNEGYWTMSDGCKIHYIMDGEGVPVLIVHGGPGEPYKKPWEGLKLINKENAFIYYDQRGCGKSDRCIDKFQSNSWNKNQPELYNKLGIERGLRDIEEMRKILGVQKISIMGHSYGGVIAALYAIEFLENVDKLVLVSPAPTIRYPIEMNLDVYEIMSKDLHGQVKKDFENFAKDSWDWSKIIKNNEKGLSEQNSYFFHYYDEYHRNINLPDSVKLIDNLVDKKNVGGWLTYGYALSFPEKFDYRNNLKSIKAPTLILWTDKDICQKQGIDDYGKNIINSKTVQFKNSGHFVFEEDPNEFSKEVADFFSVNKN